jgi:hypothetical protein
VTLWQYPLAVVVLVASLVGLYQWATTRRPPRSFDGDYLTAHGFKARGIERGRR